MRTIIAVAVVLIATAQMQAAEVKALITTAMKVATDELLPPFERATGHKVIVSYDPSGRLSKRLREGEFADMILVASPEIDKLIGEGHVVGNRIDISRTGIGIAVKKGAPKPDVSTPEALKRALLDARSIGYTNPAGGGLTAAPIIAMIEKFGIAAKMAPKTKLAAGGPTGRVSTLVASGEAEIGMQMVSELLSNPELEVIGMLPPELQLITVYSAGITANAKEPDAARALVRFLATPEAAVVYKAKGLGL